MSLHTDAVRTLDAWSAPDLNQESMRLRFLEHLLDHPDGLSRSCAPEHITAGALIVEHHLDVHYLATAPPGARPTRSTESLDLAWFPFDALPSPSDVQHLVSYASANSAPEAWVTPSRKPRARSARG